MIMAELPHIRFVTPWAHNKNIAQAYNDEMVRSFADEYVAFVDRDTIWHDPHFGRKIAEIVVEYPNAAFTCLTNRTNCRWQRWVDAPKTNDIEEHRLEAEKIWKKYEHAVHDHTDDQLWSGHLMIIPQSMWIPLKRKGLLGVDNDIHEMVKGQGGRILLMAGLYIYHYYSNFDGDGGHASRDKSHLL